jgi:sugar/nucleoside kinase (ribokinase family)
VATQPQYDIITFGDMCVDLLVTGADVTPQFGQVEKLVADYTLEMGGSACIFACQAAKLGLRVGILGRVGADDFGRLIVRRLAESAVDTSRVIVDATLKTGLGIALCQDDDRAILTYAGTLAALRPEDVTDEFLASARHLHHASYFLQAGLRPAMADIFQRAKTLGLTTSLDTNWDPDETWDVDAPNLLPYVDVLMPNEQEARYLSAQDTVTSAVAAFQAQGIPLVTVKSGADGASVYTASEVVTRRVAPAEPGGDSVGAGDSFDAGFLAGWLRGLPLAACLDIACTCGRAVAAKIGGLAGQLTQKEIFLNGLSGF